MVLRSFRKIADALGLRHQITHQRKFPRDKPGGGEGRPGDIAAGASQGGEKAEPDRIGTEHEDDRNCRGRGPRRQRRTGAADTRSPPLDGERVGREARQPFRLTIGEPVFDLEILRLDEARRPNPSAKPTALAI